MPAARHRAAGDRSSLRIGSGSGWWGDRISPAKLSAERGDLDYLCFETMAEATVSTAQVRARRDPGFAGYDTYLDDRFRAVLPGCLARGTKIISNQGWIDPDAAADRVVELLREMGVHGVRVASVTGSAITDRIFDLGDTIMESGAPLASLRETIISAEAYIGAEPIVEALDAGASIVITGRVSDPSLFVAPMIHEFGWDPLDAVRVGRGVVVGHLLECGAQVTGGYFADPGFKDVPDPWDLAFPIAEVDSEGNAVLSKVAGTGGVINLLTVKEQLFYEVGDPQAYLSPDVTADFSTVRLEDLGPDRVRVVSEGGRARPDTLKVSIGCRDGFLGEDMFFYAGHGARRRALLAREILEHRFEIVGLQAEELRIDLLGVDSIHGPVGQEAGWEPKEVAVRVAARTLTRAEAEKVGREVDGMAVSGVGMTGKRVPHQERTREVVGVWSTLVPRAAVKPVVRMSES
jgi:hypothetical protein